MAFFVSWAELSQLGRQQQPWGWGGSGSAWAGGTSRARGSGVVNCTQTRPLAAAANLSCCICFPSVLNTSTSQWEKGFFWVLFSIEIFSVYQFRLKTVLEAWCQFSSLTGQDLPGALLGSVWGGKLCFGAGVEGRMAPTSASPAPALVETLGNREMGLWCCWAALGMDGAGERGTAASLHLPAPRGHD